jgi:hypothetical protein
MCAASIVAAADQDAAERVGFEDLRRCPTRKSIGAIAG